MSADTVSHSHLINFRPDFTGALQTNIKDVLQMRGKHSLTVFKCVEGYAGNARIIFTGKYR